MFTLYVSNNCGASYQELDRSKNPSDFEEQCQKLDVEFKRWHIKNPKSIIVGRSMINSFMLSGLFGLATGIQLL